MAAPRGGSYRSDQGERGLGRSLGPTAQPNRALVLEGPMAGDAFLIYVEKVPTPTLSRADTAIIGNLSSHKVADVA